MTSTDLTTTNDSRSSTTDNNRVKVGHRKSKLTPELIDKLSSYIAKGNYFITACNACGIHKSSAYQWINKGETDAEAGVESLNTTLIDAIKKAEAEREAIIVQRLIDATMPGERKRVVKTDAEGKETLEITETGGEWLAAATFLERRHPERWGRKDRSLIQIDEHKTVTITNVEVIKDYGRGNEMIVESDAKEIEEKSNG